MSAFSKYHALGNDYLVLDPVHWGDSLSPKTIQILCDRQRGIGADGILLGPLPSQTSDFTLRIFNPDGGEAEKSGNGLRIFSRYLWDRELAAGDAFSIETKGGKVLARVKEEGRIVSVEMGQVRFTHQSDSLVTISPNTLSANGTEFTYYAASVGNPHCVIPVTELSASLAKTFGPHIEQLSLFPHRTNVQFLKVLDRKSIQIEIWERGAGYTLASGSSSTAAAAVAHALGLCDNHIEVNMPGGRITIDLDEEFFATMTGPVCQICKGDVAEEVLAQ